MSNNNTNNGTTTTATAPAPYIVTDAEYNRLLEGLKILHSVVRRAGVGDGESDMPEKFLEIASSDAFTRAICLRAQRAAESKRAAAHDANLAGQRVAVRKIIDSKRVELENLKNSVAAMPAEMRSYVTIPEYLAVPVSEFLPAFPEGTSVEDAKLALKKDHGLELMKGRVAGAGENDEKMPRVKLVFAPKAPPIPAAPGSGSNATRATVA